MATTTHLALPLLDLAQSSKEVTVNQSLTLIDAMPSSTVLQGTAAARPAFGWAGRLYFVTDVGLRRWTYDTGSAWVDLFGTYLSGGSAPTAAAGANAGTSPPAPVVVAGSNAQRGTITFGTGTAPAAGVYVVVTFPTAFPSAPYVFLQSLNATVVDLQPTVASTSTTSFSLNLKIAAPANLANTVGQFSYLTIS